jgi:hypothetical protein
MKSNEELEASIKLFTEIILMSYKAELECESPRTLEQLMKFYEDDFKDYSTKNPDILDEDIVILSPFIFSSVYDSIICTLIEQGEQLL